MLTKVLLLDDDQNMLANYSRQLKNSFDLITANSGERGLEVIREVEDVAVIVTELKLPGINGLKFLESSKAISPNAIRIILTGYPEQESIIEGVNSIGISSILIKPCSIELLKKSIEDALKRSNQTSNSGQINLYKERLKVESQKNKSKNIEYENEIKTLENNLNNRFEREKLEYTKKIKGLQSDLNNKEAKEAQWLKERSLIKERFKRAEEESSQQKKITEERYAELEESLSQKKEIHAKLELEKNKAEKKLQDLQANLENLSEEQKSFDGDGDLILKSKQFEQDNKELKKKYLSLEKKYAALEKSSNNDTKIKDQINDYEKQIQDLRVKLDKVEEEEAEIEKYKLENRELQEKLNAEIDKRNLTSDSEFQQRNTELDKFIELNNASFEVFGEIINPKAPVDSRIKKLDKFIQKGKLNIEELVQGNNSDQSKDNDSSGILKFLMNKVEKTEELKEALIKQKNLSKDSEKSEENILIQKKVINVHGAHGGSWKVAYADFVTAMMAFFLLMWLLSQLSQESRDNLKEYFQSYKAFKHSGTNNPVADSVRHSEMKDKKENKNIIEEFKNRFQGMDEQLRVIDAPGGVRIQVMDAMDKPMFEIGSAKLLPETKQIFEFVSARINELKGKIIIEGHTDSLKYQSNEKTNWELSMERASAARIQLFKNGVDQNRLVRIVGYGSAEPMNPDNALDPKNRRINIIVLNPKDDENEVNNVNEAEEGHN